MALSYKARRRWALAILLIGLPLYVAGVASVLNRFERPAIWVELLVYSGLGVIWAIPFRFLFRGIGRAEPKGEAGGSGDKSETAGESG